MRRSLITILTIAVFGAVAPVAMAAPSLSASPSTVAPGGSTTVLWSGVSSPASSNRIELYDTSGSRNVVIAWEYDNSCTQNKGKTAVASGSCPLTVPSTASTSDHYLLTLFANGTGVASTPLTVASPTPPPPPGVVVSSTPEGPPTPAGGWSVAYADGFGLPLGTGSGHDNTMFPNPSQSCSSVRQGFNSNEFEVFDCQHAQVDANGLELTCNYTPNVASFYGTTQNYTCGAASSVGSSVPGYSFFTWKPGQGQTWAVQATLKFPQNTGEADPGWWSGDGPWTEEIDFVEGFGGGAGAGGTWCTDANGGGHIGDAFPSWIYNTSNLSTIYANTSFCQAQGFDPSAAYHTYTVYINSNNCVSAYIDGKITAWEYVPTGGSCYTGPGGTQVGPPPTLSNATMGFLLSYALRGPTGNPDPYFESGTRTFGIRSIAVYENTSARGVNAFNSEVAPGTTVQ